MPHDVYETSQDEHYAHVRKRARLCVLHHSLAGVGIPGTMSGLNPLRASLSVSESDLPSLKPPEVADHQALAL